MDALITSFRRGRRTISGNQMILKVSGVDSKGKAASLVGKAASWKSPAGKEIKGKVSGAHGNNGAFRVICETGMPGQSVGQKVHIS